jgi:hypothetical protein
VPYEVTIDHETRTIAVRGFGKGTTADTLDLIASHRDTFRSCPGYNFLYDSSALDIVSSAADMLKVAEALFGLNGTSFRKFAIIVPESRVHLARIFAALAHPFGIHANVLRDVDEAHEWLALER